MKPDWTTLKPSSFGVLDWIDLLPEFTIPIAYMRRASVTSERQTEHMSTIALRDWPPSIANRDETIISNEQRGHCIVLNELAGKRDQITCPRSAHCLALRHPLSMRAPTSAGK